MNEDDDREMRVGHRNRLFDANSSGGTFETGSDPDKIGVLSATDGRDGEGCVDQSLFIGTNDSSDATFSLRAVVTRREHSRLQVSCLFY